MIFDYDNEEYHEEEEPTNQEPLRDSCINIILQIIIFQFKSFLS